MILQTRCDVPSEAVSPPCSSSYPSAPGSCDESFFAQIFHHSPTLFAISSVDDGTYQEVNNTFLQTLEFARDEVIGRSSLAVDLWHDPADRTRLVSHLREHGSFSNEEVTIRKKSGESFVGLFSGTILNLGGQQLLFTLATDVTGRKKAERELSRSKLVLEETIERQNQLMAVEAKEQERVRNELEATRKTMIDRNRQAILGQMINRIVHQWRQPLNTLGVIIQTISFEQTDREGFERAYVDRAMHIVAYMAETAEVFRSFLKPADMITHFSLNDAIARTILLFESLHSGENIGLDYSKPGRNIVTAGSGNEFVQAVLNVLENARDTLVERNVAEPRIWLDVKAQEGQAVVSVTDNGGGIEEKHLQNIFKSYFTTKPSDMGTGIGLCITKTIIEDRMGGTVSACNRGSGARFTLTIPCI